MLPAEHAMLEEKDRKLYTLLALHELGSCTYLQLVEFMVANEIMTPFDLSLALPELVDEGCAAKLSRTADCLYEITPGGEETLSFFAGRLPHSRAERIRAEAPAWRERIHSEKQFTGLAEKLPGGGFAVRLQLMDNATPLMTLELPVPDQRLASGIVSAWPRCAGEVYGHLMRALAEAQEKP